jgi:hypothetical protein
MTTDYSSTLLGQGVHILYDEVGPPKEFIFCMMKKAGLRGLYSF